MTFRIDQENPRDELTGSQAVHAFVVLWNGARNGPGRAQLFAEEETTTTAGTIDGPSPKARAIGQGRRTGSFDKARRAATTFGSSWFTSADLASRARIAHDQSAVALYALWKHGVIEKEPDSSPRRYRVIA